MPRVTPRPRLALASALVALLAHVSGWVLTYVLKWVVFV